MTQNETSTNGNGHGVKTFALSLFHNKFDASPKPVQRTWEEICARIAEPQVRASKDGSLFSPAFFDPPARKKENVQYISELVFDYDHDADFDRDLEVWRRLGLAFAAYTTHSSYRETDSNPEAEERFRVIIPLLDPIPGDQFPTLWRWAAERSGGKVDPQAKDASRMFYTPAIAEEGARYRYEINEGLPLDWRTLDLTEAEPPRQAPQNGHVNADAYGRKALETEVGRVSMAGKGGRNAQLNASAFALGQLVAGGVLQRFDVEDALTRAATGAGLSEQEIKQTLKSGIEAGMREPRSAPEKPQRQARANKTQSDSQAQSEADIEAEFQEAFANAEFEDLIESEKTEAEFWRRTHEGLADEFLKRYGCNLRYLKDLGGDLKGDHFAWWSGRFWEFRTPAVTAVAVCQREMTAEFRQYAQGILDAYAGNFDDMDKSDKRTVQFSKEIEGQGFKLNWKNEIKGYPAFHMPLTSFDTDPYLLNCKNGTLDLRTGEIRPPRRQDYLTRALDLEYDPEAKAPLWESFLRRIFADSETLIGYMRRVIGYTLTGDTSEQCLFLFHGPGANGKSVLVDVASAMLGDFAQASPMQTFTAKPNDNGASNDLARMRGARLVTASETNQGVKLNEALIKKVTGQDKITARFLFSEFFDYLPQFKLWLAMNHKPIIRGTDDGIWRRLRLIPFSVIIPEEERDKHLADKLKRELPGILAWAVRGCLEWQKDGMQTPPEVLHATEDYRTSQDVIGAFIESSCIVGEEYSVKASALYREYKKWAEDAGEHPASQTAFGLELGNRGFGKEHTRAGDFRLGIALLQSGE